MLSVGIEKENWLKMVITQGNLLLTLLFFDIFYNLKDIFQSY